MAFIYNKTQLNLPLTDTAHFIITCSQEIEKQEKRWKRQFTSQEREMFKDAFALGYEAKRHFNT